MNKRLAPDLELVCFVKGSQYQSLSCSLVEEVAELGGYLDDVVPYYVAAALRDKLSRELSRLSANGVLP